MVHWVHVCGGRKDHDFWQCDAFHGVKGAIERFFGAVVMYEQRAFRTITGVCLFGEGPSWMGRDSFGGTVLRGVCICSVGCTKRQADGSHVHGTHQPAEETVRREKTIETPISTRLLMTKQADGFCFQFVLRPGHSIPEKKKSAHLSAALGNFNFAM